MARQASSSQPRRWLLLVIAAGLWVAFVGPPLLRGEVFAFRDAAYYYFPWWCRLPVLRQQSQSWFPLWEPAEDFGRPVAADPTAAIFYPWTWLAQLPVASAFSFVLYHGLHYGWALFAAFWVLRQWGVSFEAALLGAVSYAFGGYLVAQHANTPYLVGGAWLPLALYPFGLFLKHETYSAMDGQLPSSTVCRDVSEGTSTPRLSVSQRQPILIGLVPWMIGGAAAALMMLGGDPQSAYHAAIAGALVVGAIPTGNGCWRVGLRKLLGGGIVWIGCALVLSAPQLVASWTWLGESSRASRGYWYDPPQASAEQWRQWLQTTIRQLEGSPRREPLQQIFDSARLGHGFDPRAWSEEDGYQFSVPPWRIVEWVAANFCGRTYPVVHRWTRAWYEQQTWFPSVYQGLLPALCALLSVRFLRQNPVWRWTAIVWLLAWLAAAGHYGPLSVVNAVWGTELPGEWGTVSWLLVNCLPGYGWFRYPAKWMLMASWAVAVMAASGCEALSRAEVRRCADALLLAMAVAALVAWITQSVIAGWVFPQWCQALAPYLDTSFGPVDATGAWSDLHRTWMHVALVAFVSWLLVRGTWKRLHNWIPLAGMALLAIDLWLVHAWQWQVIDPKQLQPPETVVASIKHLTWQSLPQQVAEDKASRRRMVEQEADPSPSVRLWRVPFGQPTQWRHSSSQDRFVEILKWQASTLHPKLHVLMSHPVSLFPSAASDTSRAWCACRRLLADKVQGVRSVDTLLRALGVQGVVDEKAIRRVDQPRPLVELTDGIERIPPLPSGNPVRFTMLMEVLIRADEHFAVVIEDDGKQLDDFDAAAMGRNENTTQAVDLSQERNDWKLLSWVPGRVELALSVGRPTWLIVRQSYAWGWRAAVVTDENTVAAVLPIKRAQGVFQAVYVPKGQYRLRLTYEPPGLIAALILSLLGWSTVAVTFLLAKTHVRHQT